MFVRPQQILLSNFCCQCRCCFFFLLLILLSLRRLPADDSQYLSFKYQHYEEDAGRIDIHTYIAGARIKIDASTAIAATYVLDSLAGATPTGMPAPPDSDQVPLSHLEDERSAGTVTISRTFAGLHTVSAQWSRSVESDYMSDGLALNTLHALNKKNTTLRFGLAWADDDIEPIFFPYDRHKTQLDALAGVTQVVNPNLLVTANMAYGKSHGYLSDPYKQIEKRVELDPINLPGFFLNLPFAESRPETREKWILFLEAQWYLDPLRATLESNYRYYWDDWGIVSHTLEIRYLQKLGQRLVLSPSLRYYTQEAADFYRYTLTGSEVEPQFDLVAQEGAEPAKIYREAWSVGTDGPHYSADYRLSEMETWNFGLKCTAFLSDQFTLDAALERYEMIGQDQVTPASAYAKAWTATVGLRMDF